MAFTQNLCLIRGFSITIISTCLLLTILPAMATVEAPATCQRCGMDRNSSARSRMLIVYEDGGMKGTCSLHCTLEEMKANPGKRIHSLMVAGYHTQQLIDAKTAVWVVGPAKRAGANSRGPWAFSAESEAQKFAAENGGKTTTYDQAANGGGTQTGLNDSTTVMCDGPGALMVYNPAFGDDIYHAHMAGMWMVNYRFMHTTQSDLAARDSDVSAEKALDQNGHYAYMMVPTGMDMNMSMLMVMYGLTDRIGLMGMATYQNMSMNMLMNMGMMVTPAAPVRTSGFGDTELRGVFKINRVLVASLGLGVPTGDIKQQVDVNAMSFRAPYDMQLGSGTIDLKPALTYTDLSGDAAWNWGAQVFYSYRPYKNDAGYSLGDNVKVTGWLQRAIGPAAVWARLAYSHTGRISGRDAEIENLLMMMQMSDASASNYGGHRLDGLVGISLAKGPFSFGVEGGIPFYQNLNGLQLKNQWYLTAGIQVMF